ncbi:YdcF family protein [Burkholderiaceae bacterium DAT-1]|nr:YdcF family protein [Burkholderiaceae bacterium DAT-1]
MDPLAAFYLKKWLTALMLPPWGPILLGLLGLWMLVRAHRRLSLAVFAVAGAYFLALSTPATIYRMLEPLQWPVDTGHQVEAKAQAIVVVSPGHARTKLGGMLATAQNRPILLSGGSPTGDEAEAIAMARQFVREHQRAPDWIEDQANDTWENAEFSRVMLSLHDINRVVLVTDLIHMRRACEEFRRAGFTVYPHASAADMYFQPDPDDWMPHLKHLPLGRYVAHEWIGHWVQRLRGYGQACTAR